MAVCRHRTVTPNPVLVNPESFMETSWSAGALILAVAVKSESLDVSQGLDRVAREVPATFTAEINMPEEG